MKTRELLADGFPIASVNDEDSAADAVLDAAKSVAVHNSQRAGAAVPKFDVNTRDDCREKPTMKAPTKGAK